MNYSLWAGIAGLVLATMLWIVTDEPLVVYAGVGLYWIGFLGYLGIWQWTDLTLFDERDERMELEASGLTLTVFVFVTVLGVPAMVALDVTGVYTAPATIRGMLGGYVVLFVVFGFAYAYTERSHS